MQSMSAMSSILKEVPKGFQRKASVGNNVYNGTQRSPHVGGGIDLGGYAKRDAVGRTTKAMLKKRTTTKGWK